MSVKEDYARLIDTARSAHIAGKTKSLKWRKEQLSAFIRMFEECRDEIAGALAKDLHKPKQESVSFEIDYNINTFKGALHEVEQWMRDEYVEKNVLTLLDTTYIHREPFGVVLVMGAWNYPFQLSLAPVAGALAAGNAVFVKPSELSPTCADVMQKLIHRYCDPECVRVVCGGIPETTALLKNKFDYIFFTGSTTVGKIIGDAANKHLTPCTMELGGKCPVYLDRSVDLEVAVKRIVWAKMINLGQTCVAPDYILCSAEMRDKFLAKLKTVYKEFFGPEPQKSPDLCRIVNERNFDRVSGLLTRTRGTLAFGGETDRSDLWMNLSVVTDVDPSSDSLMTEEIFGPILPIVTVSGMQEAIDLINARDKPLSLYIFSTDRKVRNAIVENTSSGSVCCNDLIVQLSVETLPFGGVGPSGYGSYHGKYTFKTFSHAKSVLERDFGFVGESLGQWRYPPYSERKMAILDMLLRKRKMPSIFGCIPWGKLFWFTVGAVSLAATRFVAKKNEMELPEWLD